MAGRLTFAVLNEAEDMMRLLNVAKKRIFFLASLIEQKPAKSLLIFVLFGACLEALRFVFVGYPFATFIFYAVNTFFFLFVVLPVVVALFWKHFV